eukprot:Nk52_evm2s2068 gene=Nk52_evmTU2s2068
MESREQEEIASHIYDDPNYDADEEGVQLKCSEDNFKNLPGSEGGVQHNVGSSSNPSIQDRNQWHVYDVPPDNYDVYYEYCSGIDLENEEELSKGVERDCSMFQSKFSGGGGLNKLPLFSGSGNYCHDRNFSRASEDVLDGNMFQMENKEQDGIAKYIYDDPNYDVDEEGAPLKCSKGDLKNLAGSRRGVQYNVDGSSSSVQYRI